MDRKKTPYILLFPAILFLVLLYGYPIVITWVQSLSHVNLLTNTRNFVGFENFTKLFSDPTFFQSLKLTVKYTGLTVFLKMVLGFIFAYLLHSEIFLKKQLRLATLLPWAIPQVAVATLWIWILDGDYGYLNYFLMKLHLIDKPIYYLSSPQAAFYITSFVDAWMGISLVSLMFIGGLDSIPRDLYEAAELDGAGKIRQFIDITLPYMRKLSLTILTLVTIWSFNSFNVIFMLTEGGPMRATETIMIKIYQEAFSRFNLGAASALSVIASLMITIMALIYMRSMRNEE